METFYSSEDHDNIRFSWNIFPQNKIQLTKNVIPLACMYAPLKKGDSTIVAPYEPLKCHGPCKTYINPFCSWDYRNLTWTCAFCQNVNKFPSTYSGINENYVPSELHPSSTTIDYILNRPTLMPAFLFVIDICIPEDEMAHLKDTLLSLIDKLPSNCYVGIITFGSNVHVYELITKLPCPKIYTFHGASELTHLSIHEFLGVGKDLGNGRLQADINNNFIIKLKNNRKLIKRTIKGILQDPFEVESLHRPIRATGAAINIAIGLLEDTFAGLGGRIMVFTGGPPTIGPGMVVSHELKESIRTHTELRKEISPHVHKATKFYERQAERVSGNGHTVDIFSCSMNQTGLLEMKSLCKNTGGLMVLSDGFDQNVFKQSLFKLFDKDENGNINLGHNATFEVITSRDLYVSGAIGNMISNKKQAKHVSNTSIGIGSTYSWKICSIDPYSNYAVFFDIKKKDTTPNVSFPLIQFQTTYQHASGKVYMRITTVARTWATSDAPSLIMTGFDQEAAAALVARLTIYQAEYEDVEPIRTIDSTLIKFYKRFSTYVKGNPNSLQAPEQLALYSQFMFYFRRGPLVQVFNNSPDETVFFRFCLNRENVSNILVMMQPSLDSYVLDEDPVPVLLSSKSVHNDNILLLDTFFHIVIHTGSLIAQWRNAGYHEHEDYENLRELLSMPVEDAAELMKSRLPLPMYVECDQGSGQARFLIASVDPTITHQDLGLNPGQENEQMILTDDVRLSSFMEKLYLFVVADN